jgi:RNA polymerase sigma-70 factor, ECF subfamily
VTAVACLPACGRAGVARTKAWVPSAPGGNVSSPGGRPARLRDQVQELCSRHRERLVRFALGFAAPGDRATAEDIVQIALLALLRKGEPLPDEEKPQLKVLLEFVARTAIKHRSRRKGRRIPDLLDDSSELLSDGTSAGGVLEKMTIRDDVRSALRILTDAEREVVELRFFEGLSYAEIARRRRCAVSTCKNLWSSARIRLRHVLHRAYGDPCH